MRNLNSNIRAGKIYPTANASAALRQIEAEIEQERRDHFSHGDNLRKVDPFKNR